jgi:MATE family multidrug resistance protein
MVRTSLLLAVFGVMNSVSARLGALTLSANALLLHLQSLQAFALDGFAHGVEVLSGEAYGASSGARLKRAVRAGAQLTMGTATLISLFYAVGSDELFALLTRHEDVSLIARELAPWAIISPLISAPCFLLDGVMVGATQGSAMRRGMSWSVLVFILSASIAVPSWGNHGLWLSLMCFMVARALTLRPKLKTLYTLSEATEPHVIPRDGAC